MYAAKIYINRMVEKEEALIATLDYTPSFISAIKEEAAIEVSNGNAIIDATMFASSKKAPIDKFSSKGLSFTLKLRLRPPRTGEAEPSFMVLGSIYRVLDQTTKWPIQPNEKFYLTNSPAEIIANPTNNGYALKIMQFNAKKDVIIPLVEGLNKIGREYNKSITENEISRSHLLINVGPKLYLTNLSKSGGTFVKEMDPEFPAHMPFIGRITDGFFIKIQNLSRQNFSMIDTIIMEKAIALSKGKELPETKKLNSFQTKAIIQISQTEYSKHDKPKEISPKKTRPETPKRVSAEKPKETTYPYKGATKIDDKVVQSNYQTLPKADISHVVIESPFKHVAEAKATIKDVIISSPFDS
jgi:hypothetical protein